MTTIRIDRLDFPMTPEGLGAAFTAARDQWYDMIEVTEAMGAAYDTAASNFSMLAKAARQMHREHQARRQP